MPWVRIGADNYDYRPNKKKRTFIEYKAGSEQNVPQGAADEMVTAGAAVLIDHPVDKKSEKGGGSKVVTPASEAAGV